MWLLFFSAMKQVFAGQHFDTTDDLFPGVDAFLGTSYRRFFRNGSGDCSYAVRAAENIMSEQDTIRYLVL
jgi:hypothetical protein